MPAPIGKEIPVRVQVHVWSRIMRGHPTACWHSTWSVGSHGRPQIGWSLPSGKSDMVTASRAVWTAVHGQIPDEMTVDHICRNGLCLNPAHLRLLTNLENATDNGQGRKTHCPHGHAYDDENTYRSPRGDRRCRQCARDRRKF